MATRIDQTAIKDSVPELCIMVSITLKKGEARVTYMQNYELFNEEEGIWICEVFSIAISADTEHNKHVVPAHGFRHEQEKDSCCPQASSTVGLDD